MKASGFIRLLAATAILAIVPIYAVAQPMPGPNETPPPELTEGDLSLDPDQLINDSSEATIESMRKHFKSTYGTEDGPFAQIEEQEKALEEAKRRISAYNMTAEQRRQMLAAEAAAESGDAAAPAAPEGGYVYNPGRTQTTAPPRLFNNVTP